MTFYAVRYGDAVQIRKAYRRPIGIRSTLTRKSSGLRMEQVVYTGGSIVGICPYANFGPCIALIKQGGILQITKEQAEKAIRLGYAV